MNDIILKLTDIKKSFGGVDIIKNLSLEIIRGEFVTLLGPSGCGKTTTLRIISGLEKLDGGKVFLNGVDVTSNDANERNVNTVFQNYALFPHMNVYDNIGYGPKIKKVNKKQIHDRVLSMLSLVQMDGYEKRMPHQLSGGQRQRIAIARALVNEPDIILLDEPLGALDLKLRQHMQTELKQLQKKTGVTFIYVTHDQEEALNMSDKIAVMNNGRIEQYNAPAIIYNNPKTLFVAEFVGERNIWKNGPFAYAVHTDKTILSKTPNASASIEASVTDKTFTGSQTKITVSANDGTAYKVVEYNSEKEINIGNKVYIGWKNESAVKIPI